MSDAAIREQIVLEIVAPQKAAGLSDLVRQLKDVEAHIEKVNSALNGMKLGPAAARSMEQLRAQIQSLQTKQGMGLNLGELSKNLGLDAEQFRKYLAERRKALKDIYSFSKDEFRSSDQAARMVSRFEGWSAKNRRLALGDLMTPSVSEVRGQRSEVRGQAKVEGQIPLTIPAAQVQASVVGQITLAVSAGQVTPSRNPKPEGRNPKADGAGGSPKSEVRSPKSGTEGTGRDASTGRFLPGGGGGPGRPASGRKKGGGGGGPLDVPQQPGEFERLRVETDDLIRETVTRADALGQTVSETWDNVEQAIVKTVRKSTTGTSPLEQFRLKRKLEEEAFKKEKHGAKGNLMALSKLEEKQAGQIQNLLTPELQSALGSQKAAQLQKLLDAQADTLRQQAVATSREALTRSSTEIRKTAEGRAKASAKTQSDELASARRQAASSVALRRTELMTWEKGNPDVFRSGAGKNQFFSEMAQASEDAATRLEAALKRNRRARKSLREDAEGSVKQHRANAELFRAQAGGSTPGPTKPAGEYARFLNGMQAFSPMGMLANLTKVTGWAAAVTVLYKSVELARYSMERFLAVGQQTARLEQVFRGVGGTAQQLTTDILGLAAANGRSTEEAMESAVEWSRLGLTRAQVNDAVRVSMVAANVAHMHTAETTKQLSTLMHVYHLQVKDLDGVLGGLVHTTLNYNVTLEDLFTGLDRSAGVARQTGMNLAELQGLIGATVGKTGQSGVIVGNTIKSVLLQFNNPSIQNLMRSYGVETLTKEGQAKSGSQVMRELFVRWQSMDDRERRSMVMAVAGRQQGARFVSMMEGYVQAQQLAIGSQLHLNSAQQANLRILDAMKTQLAGVRGEWDRLVVAQLTMPLNGKKDGKSAGDAMTTAARTGKNLLRLFNQSGLSLWDMIPANLNPFPFRTAGMGAAWNFGFGMMLPKAVRQELREKMGGTGILDAFNYLMEPERERSRGKMANQLQEHRSAAVAHAMQARLLDTVSEALPHANRPAMVQTMVDAAAEQMEAASADAFKKAVAGNDIAKAQGILGEQSSHLRGMSVAEVEASLKVRNRYITEDRHDIADLDSQISKLQGVAGAEEELANKKRERAGIDKELRQYLEENNEELDFLKEEAAETEEVIALKQQYLNLLKQQQMLMGSLEQLAEQNNLPTMGARLDAQVGGMDQQLDMLRESRERLLHPEGRSATQEDIEAAKQLQKEIEEVQAKREAMNSPQMREMAGMYDARQITARRAQEEAGSLAVGYTEADKLLKQEHELQTRLKQMREKENRGQLTAQDATRAKEYEIQLWNTQEKIQSRIIDLARQEKQIRMDAAREFQRGLLMASPGEMLQRFHVAQMMRRPGGVSAGEFFSLSPQTRQMYYDAMGGQAGANARWERRQFQGHDWTVEREQQGLHDTRRNVEHWNSFLRKVVPGAANTWPQVPLPGGVDKAKQLNDQFGSLTAVAGGTVQAFGRLQKAIDNFANFLMPGGELAGNSRNSTLNISAGYSLGARALT